MQISKAESAIRIDLSIHENPPQFMCELWDRACRMPTPLSPLTGRGGKVKPRWQLLKYVPFMAPYSTCLLLSVSQQRCGSGLTMCQVWGGGGHAKDIESIIPSTLRWFSHRIGIPKCRGEIFWCNTSTFPISTSCSWWHCVFGMEIDAVNGELLVFVYPAFP